MCTLIVHQWFAFPRFILMPFLSYKLFYDLVAIWLCECCLEELKSCDPYIIGQLEYPRIANERNIY